MNINNWISLSNIALYFQRIIFSAFIMLVMKRTGKYQQSPWYSNIGGLLPAKGIYIYKGVVLILQTN